MTFVNGVESPEGTVTFFDDGQKLETDQLSNGMATFITNTLDAGTHEITAVYNGDDPNDHYNDSPESDPCEQVIKKGDTLLGLSITGNQTYGQSLMIGAILNPVVPAPTDPTGTIEFFADGSKTAFLTIDAGDDPAPYSSFPAGTHKITAAYTGDENFNASESATLTVTIAKAALTLTVDPQGINNSDPFPIFTYKYSGFANGDTSNTSNISATVNVSTTATSASGAGYYPIHATVTSFSSPNYTIGTVVDGTLTIRPKVVDVRVDYGNGRSMSLMNLTRDLPFATISAIDVIFSDNVFVPPTALKLTGVNGGNYSPILFAYNSITHDATYQLPKAIGADRLTLALSGVTAMPTAGTGPAIAINPFSDGFSVLPGDVDGDGMVSAADAIDVRNAMLIPYDVWDDVLGDGTVDISDFNAVRKLIGTHLP